jgi:hypothetical protein
MNSVGYAQVKAARDVNIGRSIAKRKGKKVNWFKRKFAQWCREAWENRQDGDSPQLVTADHESLQSDGMRFQLYRANGGYVVETRSYDRKSDRNTNKLYIIKDEEDVGETIGKIITMESLR